MKIKLYGIGNYENFNYYIFDKSRKVHEILRPIIQEVFGLVWPLMKEVYNKKDMPEINKIDISKKEDVHERIVDLKGKSKARINLFYGSKKMFLTVHCGEEQRKQFNLKLNKMAEMPE
jgi:hypothetical protein